MKSKIFIFTLVLSLVLNISIVSFADGFDDYATLNSPTLTEEEEKQLHDKIEESLINNKDDELNLLGQITTYGPIAPAGTTDYETFRYSTGAVFQDESSGIFDDLNDEMILVLSLIPATSVILSVSSYVDSNVDNKKWAHAKTYLSYSYFGKNGLVSDGSKFDVWWKTESRDTFKHYWSSWTQNDGYTRSGTQDFIPPNGYSAIRTELSAHLNDITYIKDTAYNNYIKGYWYYQAEYGY